MENLTEDLEAMWALLDRDEPDHAEMRESFSALRNAETSVRSASQFRAMRWLLICQSSLHAATVQNLSHLQTSSMLCPVFKVSADFLRALRVLVLWRRVPLIDACLFTTVLWPVRDGVLERTAF